MGEPMHSPASRFSIAMELQFDQPAWPASQAWSEESADLIGGRNDSIETNLCGDIPVPFFASSTTGSDLSWVHETVSAASYCCHRLPTKPPNELIAQLGPQ
ncbi:unnamed protein product [Fusarium graminearum]|uniref:Chromosome 3, complete genome n=2 Tax=Gibberella zeae TaxID=5518 RepID=A0A098E4I3_GIBZE|nr:unnamed protein product [Fusarium graminearum]CAG1980437.1 unnamed protein product [Fusarium graminearum]CAG1981717.1 unnamed protein product [Fusarium graminearum]CAG1985427.1 unnamed protein product [Fusarium graminearum]CAG2010712.1 unnamed protein product [Fusarium graminearum]